jgi:hypothetical protein
VSAEIVLVVLVILLVAGFLVYRNVRQSPTGERATRLVHAVRDDTVPSAAREPTLETLAPGDAIAFWDGENAVVECVLECEELVDGRRTGWRWHLLSGGRLLEVAPDGNVLYTRGEVIYQGSAVFDQLTGPPAAGGVLQLFEARVRARTLGANPVTFAYQGREFTVRSTGTFRATPLGPPPRGEVWRDISDDPRQNTYFELEAADGTQGLGIWTTHILLLLGERLQASDIRGLYPAPPD